MKVVLKNVGEKPKVKIIDKSLESMQSIVGGYIEVMNIIDNIILVVNEEGKINHLDTNFEVAFLEKDVPRLKDVICGNCFFVAHQGSDFTSLSDSQADFIKNSFNEQGTYFLIERRRMDT